MQTWIKAMLLVLVTAWGVAQPAEARRIPMLPTELSDADRQAIHTVAGVDASQVVELRGLRRLDGDQPAGPVLATLSVVDDELAPTVMAGRRFHCHAPEDGRSPWVCDTQPAIEMLYVTLPEPCSARLESSSRTVPMLRTKGPTTEQAIGLAEAICHSDRLAAEAWSQGHRLMSAGKDHDGKLFRVMTYAPDSLDHGFSFLLEEQCDELGRCRFVVVQRHGWMT